MLETAERYEELPKPEYEVIKMTLDNSTDDRSEKQWLVKTKHKHLARIIHPVQDGKVKPPSFGQTDHVLVTVRKQTTKHNGEQHKFEQTSVFASDADGTFYDAMLYCVPRTLDMHEIMFAIGEI